MWIDPVNPIEVQESLDNDICLPFEQSLYNEIPESAFEKKDFDPEQSDDEAECDEKAGSAMEADEESELVDACKALCNLQEANIVDQLACQLEIPNKVSPAGVSAPDEGAEILSYCPLETLSKEERDLGIVPFLTNGMEDLYFLKETNQQDISPLEFSDLKKNPILATVV